MTCGRFPQWDKRHSEEPCMTGSQYNWVNLTDMVLSQRSQIQKNWGALFPFIGNFKKAKVIRDNKDPNIGCIGEEST